MFNSYSQIIYGLVFAIILTGIWGMLARPNLVRKLMAMNILQVGVIFFFIVLAFKKNGVPPIANHTMIATEVINPLPHGLMLTAIVVGVATTGVALALVIRINKRFGTIMEPDILELLKK